jgi:hypothetical protein
VNCLNVWSMRGIDLSKIESRPINANWHHLHDHDAAEVPAPRAPRRPRPRRGVG